MYFKVYIHTTSKGGHFYTLNTQYKHTLTYTVLVILSQVLLSTSSNSKISIVLSGGVFIQTQALSHLVELRTDSDRVLSPNDRPLVLQALITRALLHTG